MRNFKKFNSTGFNFNKPEVTSSKLRKILKHISKKPDNFYYFSLKILEDKVRKLINSNPQNVLNILENCPPRIKNSWVYLVLKDPKTQYKQHFYKDLFNANKAYRTDLITFLQLYWFKYHND